MRLALLTMAAILALAGCGDKQEITAEKPVSSPAPARQHNYVLHDDGAYGYERANSAEDIQRGRKATDIVMVRYVGQKDGKWQLAIEEDSVFSVFECASPCEFVKAMAFDGEGPAIKVERMRVEPGVLVYHMMEDAINGKLSSVMGLQKNGKAYYVWFDEKKGPILTPANKQ